MGSNRNTSIFNLKKLINRNKKKHVSQTFNCNDICTKQTSSHKKVPFPLRDITESLFTQQSATIPHLQLDIIS
jgi:hypothetical protein